MFDYICPECGGVAFSMTELPEPGSPLRSKAAVFKDGSHPEPHSNVECQECHSPIHALQRQRLTESQPKH